MLGFSVYLHEALTQHEIDRIQRYADVGFEGVFTSINLPEDDPSQLISNLAALGDICKANHLQMTLDVSTNALDRLDISRAHLDTFEKLGVSTLRIDDGFDMTEIAQLSQKFQIALNASTITSADIDVLTANQADFTHLEAWHNYYPREFTGLDEEWFANRNRWLQANGFTVMAFVPGDGERRGPVFAGLPTLEKQRYMHPLAAMIEMKRLAVTHVFIGDPELKATTLAQIEAYTQQNILEIHAMLSAQAPNYFDRVLHQRADVARDVVRIVEGRLLLQNKIAAINTISRNHGAITLDNHRSGRYEGELELIKCSLPADPSVNVIGQIVPADLDLLNFIDANQAIQIVNVESETYNG
ncbi:MupG family TIM beta-alpha barrel fold protein [Lacticaseibacillus saniviri]|uniref:Outer surface protein n=1 Tax=Lacticaseibacillus saniviri JCM 17471 = DSM 24301 TaxID=1293598 RepID=A0A0R2MPE1_9LACO|nr:MupG family TIM beta-alpha barrel fold protein [Lacticaseibacillus saniviri]KRO15535.1 hypothetical protein IV56_GL002304 [Lacticaseibacillus saniviri JCM 17471 = DSM 24301]MCG4281643.1 MupG family TIM beta-alpha barrel fold protein [Lacticaseibacillus saniviri]